MSIYTPVLPYVYQCTHKITGEFYFGYRKANKVNSSLDFGIHYKTSSKLVKPIFDQFSYCILAEFFDSTSAHDFEQSLIKEHWSNPLLLNKSYGGDVATNKGLINVKDKSGKIFKVSVNDPRYTSGELQFFHKGISRSDEFKHKQSIANKGKVNVKDSSGTIIRVDVSESHLYTPMNSGSKKTKETRAKISKSSKEQNHTRNQIKVSRLDDKKPMTLNAFNRWLNETKTVMPPKIICCRLSDKKEISVNHLNREPTPLVCRLSDRKVMSIINFKKYTTE